MGILGAIFKTFTGSQDNIEIAAKSIAGLYFHCECNYLETFKIRYASLFSQLLGKIETNGIEYYEMTLTIFLNNRLPNLMSLAIADLSINAAPKNIPITATMSSFGNEIASYLIKYNIDLQYIVNDNSEVTSSFVENFVANLNRR